MLSVGCRTSASRFPGAVKGQFAQRHSTIRHYMHHAAMSGGQCGAAGTAAAAAAAARPSELVWFRNDLRLADHDALHAATWELLRHRQQLDALGSSADCAPLLLPFYCLDNRELAPAGQLGLPRLGPHQLRLLLEALAALRAALRDHSSDLLVSQGAPEAAVGRLVALAAAAGSTHVTLRHYSQPGGASAAVEHAVAAALAAAAAQHGLGASVHRYWGCTLYHPDDLPYRLFLHGSPAGGSGGSGGSSSSTFRPGPGPDDAARSAAGGRAAAPETLVAGAAPASEGAPLSQGAGSSYREQERYACLPRVMSDFRRAVQEHTPVRPPLPAPRAAANHSSGSGGGSSSEACAVGSDAPELPPLPAGILRAASEAGMLAAIPMQPAAVYAAAGPEAQAALARWERLTGQRCASLAPAGSGTHDPRCAVPFAMGEQEALQRLHHLLGLPLKGGEGSMKAAAGRPLPMDGYQDNRMLAFGVDSSAKLSAFLALGCLSPRTAYSEVLRQAQAQAESEQGHGQCNGQQAERQQQAEQAEQQGQVGRQQAQQGAALGWREPQRGDTWRWLLMHLGIRDFFIYSALREGELLERPQGLSDKEIEWRHDEALLLQWTMGQTGVPFVDACMRELAATGYTSNRGRQNVASFLSKALGLDWRWGAEYFGSVLGDHDWALNLGNWAYNSGVGADPRDRRFCTVSQGLRYDPDATLVRAWVPELAGLAAPELIHQPWAAAAEQLAAAGVRLVPSQGVVPEGGGEEAEAQVGRAPDAAAALVTAAVAAGSTKAEQRYPFPLVDPATQVAKGPRQKQKQAVGQAKQPRKA